MSAEKFQRKELHILEFLVRHAYRSHRVPSEFLLKLIKTLLQYDAKYISHIFY